MKPDPSPPPGAPGRSGAASQGSELGSELKGVVMPRTRAIVRATLAIPPVGNAAWQLEDLNWADPG